MIADQPTRPTAIIIGGDVNGLGVARSLARHNIPLLILDTDLQRPTMRTRYGRKMALPSLSGPSLLESLRSLRASFAQMPVLFPTQEAGLATLAGDYAQIRQNYRLALPEHPLVQTLLDKNLFQTRAEELGFTVPRSRALGRGMSESVFQDLRFPCVVKPATKDDGYARQFAKAYRVSTKNEAVALWNKIQTVVPTAIIQEWIEGADSDVYFCLQYRPQNGNAISFCGRKTLQWPSLVGGTATCIPTPEAESVLMAETSNFFDKVGFVGLCSMEFKRDTRDGKFYMVEPTVGRTDYQEEIATLNGVNIPLAAYCDLTGMAMPSNMKSDTLRGWRDPFGYKNAVTAGAHDPAADLMPHARLVDAYFRLDDPMPFLHTTPLRKIFQGRQAAP